MQPIVWIAIVGVAITGISMGTLAPGFDLNLQLLGAQEQDLVAPITTANIDFIISAIDGVGQQGPIIKNQITFCSFHSPQAIGTNGVIICKLTDSVDDVVAEGKLVLTTAGLAGSVTTFIQIDQTASENANDVQNIFDVKIVVLGANPTP